MLLYCRCRDELFKKIEEEGRTIPEETEGSVLLRDAHLPDEVVTPPSKHIAVDILEFP